jgi:Flp pilus assembly protein TadG
VFIRPQNQPESPAQSSVAARRRRRPGAETVEFAVASLPVFLLIFGFIEFGRALMTMELMTSACRIGCRQAIIYGATTSGVQNTVTQNLNSLGISGGSLNVSVSPALGGSSPPKGGDPITVTASVAYSDVSWLPVPQWVSGNLQGQYSLPLE